MAYVQLECEMLVHATKQLENHSKAQVIIMPPFQFEHI